MVTCLWGKKHIACIGMRRIVQVSYETTNICKVSDILTQAVEPLITLAKGSEKKPENLTVQ
jgi:hypothetical protein